MAGRGEFSLAAAKLQSVKSQPAKLQPGESGDPGRKDNISILPLE